MMMGPNGLLKSIELGVVVTSKIGDKMKISDSECFKYLIDRGCRILPKDGNPQIMTNKDKYGYNFVIIPDSPYSIVVIRQSKNNIRELIHNLEELIKETERTNEGA